MPSSGRYTRSAPVASALIRARYPQSRPLTSTTKHRSDATADCLILSTSAAMLFSAVSAPMLSSVAGRSLLMVTSADIAADDLDPRPERRRALPLPAAAPQHQRATRPCLGRQLFGQPSLADTGLSGHQHHPTVPG